MKRIWFPVVAFLALVFTLVPINAVFANGITYPYTYHQINMAGVFNSDAYTRGLNYTSGSSGSYYPVNPGTTYSDPVYGNVPMNMVAKGQNNVWLSGGLDRTSTFSTQITLTTNIQYAVAIWLVGFDGGWVYAGKPIKVGYRLDGAYSEITYRPNDWGYDGSGDANLALWVDHNTVGANWADISVARIDLPHAGTLTEIKVIDTGTEGSYPSFPIFAVTVAQLTTVNVDIKPMSYPNPFNVNAKGVLPVAILGTATFDVSQINPALVRLEGVTPLRWALEDVGTPDNALDGPDGYIDLTFKFDSQAIISALGTINDGDIITLALTGKGIRGDDEIVIIKK